MQLAYALHGPPGLKIRPSATCEVSKDVFGLSHDHDYIYGLIMAHLRTKEAWYQCQQLMPGEEFSLGKSIPCVSLEEHSDDFDFLEGSSIEFVLVAKSKGNHFVYRVNFTLPWALSPQDHFLEMIAGTLAGDRELQDELESTVKGGSAEKLTIYGIEVIMFEWREI